MTKIKKPISFETTFGTYVVQELIGEGGAGRVYGGIDGDGTPIALKVLAEDRATANKRRRFKNEIAFLAQNKHANIVTVIDHGIAHDGAFNGPFYVMRKYDGNLRDRMRTGTEPGRVLRLFSQVLDGVEAAHLQGVVHRDLKPENILWDKGSEALAIADFGIAHFSEDILVTLVETSPAERLANFQYAAPEQRIAREAIGTAADIYALGLILNEMFTGAVPHGTEPRTIAQAAAAYGFLDPIVTRMLRQAPGDRPSSIAEVKQLVQRNQAEAVSLQRLSQIDGTVIKSTEIDEPLAQTPPKLIDVDWNRGVLTLILDRAVTPEWIGALQHMGSYSSVSGKPPQAFSFQGKTASITAQEHEIQSVIHHFKQWLPAASRVLKALLEEAAQRDEAERKEQLRREREAEEQRLRVRRNIRL